MCHMIVSSLTTFLHLPHENLRPIYFEEQFDGSLRVYTSFFNDLIFILKTSL